MIVANHHKADPIGLFDADGAWIPAHVDELAVDDGIAANPLARLVPEEPLPARAFVEVRFADDPPVGFTTTDLIDTEAPSAPTLGGPVEWSDGPCPPFVSIDVESSEDVALFIARRGAPPTLQPHDVWHGVAAHGEIVVAGDAHTTETIFVAAVDRAGNVGEAASVVATFPAGAGVCACASTTPVRASSAVVVVPWVLLRRRATTARRGPT